MKCPFCEVTMKRNDKSCTIDGIKYCQPCTEFLIAHYDNNNIPQLVIQRSGYDLSNMITFSSGYELRLKIIESLKDKNIQFRCGPSNSVSSIETTATGSYIEGASLGKVNDILYLKNKFGYLYRYGYAKNVDLSDLGVKVTSDEPSLQKLTKKKDIKKFFKWR